MFENNILTNVEFHNEIGLKYEYLPLWVGILLV
jgi:hypothetical protein